MIKAKDVAKLTQSEVKEQNIKFKDIIFEDNDEDNITKKAWFWGWRGIGYYHEGCSLLTRKEYNNLSKKQKDCIENE